MANFGVDGSVASYIDVDQADLLCLYGHNVAEVQAVLWERILAAKKGARGANRSRRSAPYANSAPRCGPAPPAERRHERRADERNHSPANCARVGEPSLCREVHGWI